MNFERKARVSWWECIFQCRSNLRKFNSHLQYYKFYLSFSIKLQEINLNVSKEHKTERDDWIGRPRRVQICARRENIIHICNNKKLTWVSVENYNSCYINILLWIRKKRALLKQYKIYEKSIDFLYSSCIKVFHHLWACKHSSGECIGFKFIQSLSELFRFIPISVSEPMRIIPYLFEKPFVFCLMENGQKSIRLNPMNSETSIRTNPRSDWSGLKTSFRIHLDWFLTIFHQTRYKTFFRLVRNDSYWLGYRYWNGSEWISIRYFRQRVSFLWFIFS